MIVVTGAAGFIGSCLVNKLNNKGFKDIIIVDDFSKTEKLGNIKTKIVKQKIERNDFISWFDENSKQIDFVFHLGARTDTTEFNKTIFDELNVGYSQKIWNICVKYAIPLIYASSAATYGLGEFGFVDNHNIVNLLKPLNPYGESKNDFDKWVLAQEKFPPFWFGLKFFNVFGPNEYHKGRMASVVFHAYHQIKNNGNVKLFKSHHPEYEDGKQLRDFIYVKDVIDICMFLMLNKPQSGIFNVGTGVARSFLDLANGIFSTLNISKNIEFIDTPIDIRDKYQYYTVADMNKLKNIGYKKQFFSLEEGIADYLECYLIAGSYY